MYETGQFFLSVQFFFILCSKCHKLELVQIFSGDISLKETDHLCKHINGVGSNPMPRIRPYRKLECEDSLPTTNPYQSLRVLLSLP